MTASQAQSLLSKDWSTSSPEEILKAAITHLGKERVVLASSFGAEDVVLIHMLTTITPKPRIFCLDTGRLPQETYDVMDRIRNKYKLSFEIYFPNTQAVEKMVREKGVNLFYESIDNRKLCCGIRKVEPLKRALLNCDGWITGLRREQSMTRTAIPVMEIDRDHGNILKINPLAAWTHDQVWDYIRAHKVPYNALHDKGYPSIGCAPCTRAISPGEDPRAGRWWWENPETKECGLHVKSSKTSS